MNHTKRLTGKINTDECKLFISEHTSIEGYLIASILYKKYKTGSYENQIGFYDLKSNIFKTEIEALEWANLWVQTNFQTDPNFVAE